jgi:soluble lytic murein transglycosylase-like protein
MNTDFRHPGTGMFGRFGLRRALIGTLLAVVAGPFTAAVVHAANQMALESEPGSAAAAVAGEPNPLEQPKLVDPPNLEAPKAAAEPASSFRAAVRAMVEQEVEKTGLPADIADAVVHVESNYDPSIIGSVGEIGLMQIRPGTAAMLGFKGSAEDLAKPEINIHYGVTYLSQAWRLANGDLCRTLMKYRAGHGEELMTPRSISYCNRARNHLAALGSPSAVGAATPPAIIPASVLANTLSKLPLNSPKDVYAQYRQGTPSASRAFWAAHEARVRAITALIESRWHRMASR